MKDLQKCLKPHLKIITKLPLYFQYRMSSITGKIMQISVVAKKVQLHNIAEIETEAVRFHLLARELH